MSDYNIAVVGATGAVGEMFLEILGERKFPLAELFPLASEKSVGKTVQCQGRSFKVLAAFEFDFSKVDIAFFSAGSKVAKQLAPKAAAAGCVVIDNSSAFRYDENVPLVVPEINSVDIIAHGTPQIIANPNCATIPLCIAFAPLLKHYGVESAQVVTFQSVSGSGRKGLETLVKETTSVLNVTQSEAEDSALYREQIAFNVVPFIDELEDNGFTREEMKLFWETKKILGDDQIKVSSTTVRVPVFYGHSEAVTVKLRADFSLDTIKELLLNTPGICLVDEQKEALTPLSHGVNTDSVYISRLRRDLADDNSLSFWLVCDNIRKGAALNGVQIAECFAAYQARVIN